MSVLRMLSRPGAGAGNAIRRLALRLVRLAVTATVVATIVVLLDALLLDSAEDRES